MNELILSERMPVLAMRGLVLFPQATMHFDVGREKSVRALEAAMNADQHIFLVTQKEIEQDVMSCRKYLPPAGIHPYTPL